MVDNYDMNLWVWEMHQGTFGMSFKVQKTLFSDRSRFQKVDIVKTESHGLMLINDGRVMLTERDEFVYHEMIAHVPLFVHPDPKRVLVIGGGDGGTVREVLKHKQIERVLMVEIDEMVVQACREYLPSVSYALDDPRLELRIDDGIKFVMDTREKFDVVIVDSTDPIGPATPLFNEPFYKGVAEILEPDGILITQAESPFYDQQVQKSMLSNQRPYFNKLHMYLYTTLTYPGGLWSFSFASKGPCPIKDFEPARVEKSGIRTQYYNPGIHRGSFLLPNFTIEKLASVLDPIRW
jgi:spermidine synthase